jgi:hypothetical protein
MSANPVIVTPQTGFADVLKPFSHFENTYQGQSSQIPIAVPGGIERSAAIGTPGYDPNLMEGTPVIMGGKVILWLPRIYNGYLPGPVYSYSIYWRVRSIADQDLDPARKLTGHLGRQLAGTPNDNDPKFPRFVIPTAIQTVTYQQTEPSDTDSPGIVHIRTARYDVLAGSALGAFGSGPFNQNSLVNPPPGVPNRGIYTQGIFPNPNGELTGTPNVTLGTAGGAIYNAIELRALGDEMVIMIQRFDTVTPANEFWDFTNPLLDQGLSEFLGTNGGTREPLPNTGILLFSTSAT